MRERSSVQRDAVLAALTPRAVFERFAVDGAVRGGQFRTRSCPACGFRSRDSVVIDLESGLWSDKAHGCGGDLLAMVAGYAGIDARAEFPRLLELAANIAGVAPGMDRDEVKRATERRRQYQTEAAALAQRERTIAAKQAGTVWRNASIRDKRGEEYLRSRGLDPLKLIASCAVRFDYGDPVVALFSSGGEVINVVRRKVAPDAGPKVLGMRHCATAGTLVGKLRTMSPGRLVVITEGVADTLAAVLAWPRAVVLGAHGASNMEAIGKGVAKVGAGVVTRVLVVAHRDPERSGKPGVGQVAAAAAAAHLPGVAEVVDVAPHKDLAEAWREGWRP